MQSDKKNLKRKYQQSARPMGVFLIRNNLNDKVFLGASLSLDGVINRHKFQLQSGLHANRELQADWNTLGSDSFAFEIVDELTPGQTHPRDYRRELEALEILWLERLAPFGERGYNVRKKTRDQILREIAARRLE